MHTQSAHEGNANECIAECFREVGPAAALTDMGHGRKSLTKVVRQVAPAVCGRNAHDLQLVTDSVETEFR